MHSKCDFIVEMSRTQGCDYAQEMKNKERRLVGLLDHASHGSHSDVKTNSTAPLSQRFLGVSFGDPYNDIQTLPQDVYGPSVLATLRAHLAIVTLHALYLLSDMSSFIRKLHSFFHI